MRATQTAQALAALDAAAHIMPQAMPQAARPAARQAARADAPQAARATDSSGDARVTGTPRADEGLTGPEFTGVLPSAGSRHPIPIRVVRFGGDHVEALIHTRAAGESPRRLHARALVGLKWLEQRCDPDFDCVVVQYRIFDVEQDHSRNTMPAHSDNSDIWLYRVQSRRVAVGATWQDVCAPDREVVARGIFVNGQWRRDGSFTPGGYTFSCTGGVIAKCARSWGYKPWQKRVAGDRVIDLQPLHQACVRAARADYCGDGISYTRDGTYIDISDAYGLNAPEPSTDFTQEAGFDENGALWVNHKRWPTGHLDTTTWVHLPTCRKPRSPGHRARQRALLSVWSRPR